MERSALVTGERPAILRPIRDHAAAIRSEIPATKEFTVGLVAALPMYDWPDVRAETDAQWERLRDELRLRGIDAPERVARTRQDLPSVPGGIRDAGGKVKAPDPENLP